MKVVFAGPSLHGSEAPKSDHFVFRAPAAQGDLYQAVMDGANVIGLIDGVYEHVPAIWHKEILFALSLGVQVFGGASLGALRAVECAPFGMIGIGEIFDGYMNGRLVDDSDVALLHGPPELDYLPLSEPLVNVQATVRYHAEAGFLASDEAERLLGAAQALFFKNRTWHAVLAAAQLPLERAEMVLARMRGHRVNLKRRDAEHVLDRVSAAEDCRLLPPTHWDFARTSLFEKLVAESTSKRDTVS